MLPLCSRCKLSQVLDGVPTIAWQALLFGEMGSCLQSWRASLPREGTFRARGPPDLDALCRTCRFASAWLEASGSWQSMLQTLSPSEDQPRSNLHQP